MTRFEQICALNPNIVIHTAHDPEFSKYGRVITEIDVSDLIEAAKKYAVLPREGFSYETSVPALEDTKGGQALAKYCWGEMDAQIGIGYGNANSLDALEYHTCGETSVAVTDMVFLIADRRNIKDGWLDSKTVEAFYVAEGEVIDLYATTLHYCPAEIDSKGISSIVLLQRGTNEPLENKSDNPLLFAKNKWIFTHESCKGLIDQGIPVGICGENLKLNSIKD